MVLPVVADTVDSSVGLDLRSQFQSDRRPSDLAASESANIDWRPRQEGEVEAAGPRSIFLKAADFVEHEAVLAMVQVEAYVVAAVDVARGHHLHCLVEVVAVGFVEPGEMLSTLASAFYRTSSFWVLQTSLRNPFPVSADSTKSSSCCSLDDHRVLEVEEEVEPNPPLDLASGQQDFRLTWPTALDDC